MLVIFYPEKQEPTRKGLFYVNGICLKPGRNKYTVKEMSALKKSPTFTDFIAKGIVEILDSNKVKEEVAEIKALIQTEEVKEIIINQFSVKEAEKIINTETSIPQLEKYLQQETETKDRESVLTAIKRQIANLNNLSL